MHNSADTEHFTTSRNYSNFTTIASINTTSDTTSGGSIGVVTNIYVDHEIIQHLQMKNHERKSRLSISSRDPSLSSLRALISKKLVALTEHHLYKIRYSINEAVEDDMMMRPLTSDEDFRHAINQAIHMKSSLRLYIQINPGIFPPLDAMDRADDGHDSALKDMYSSLIDPADTDSYTMLSFYGFEKIDDSEAYSMMLKKLWSPFKALGRVSINSLI